MSRRALASDLIGGEFEEILNRLEDANLLTSRFCAVCRVALDGCEALDLGAPAHEQADAGKRVAWLAEANG